MGFVCCAYCGNKVFSSSISEHGIPKRGAVKMGGTPPSGSTSKERAVAQLHFPRTATAARYGSGATPISPVQRLGHSGRVALYLTPSWTRKFFLGASVAIESRDGAQNREIYSFVNFVLRLQRKRVRT